MNAQEEVLYASTPCPPQLTSRYRPSWLTLASEAVPPYPPPPVTTHRTAPVLGSMTNGRTPFAMRAAALSYTSRSLSYLPKLTLDSEERPTSAAVYVFSTTLFAGFVASIRIH